MKNLVRFLLFIIIIKSSFAQQKYPENYFISPLDVSIALSGTFGELRSNHFHSGIDIRTGEVEGLNVKAIADGYVSRIKVSADGYGKALYITHNNGYVSVYAHLKKYNSIIEEHVKRTQYQKESYAVEIFPVKNAIMVKQGEVIALSGNSGSSGGPHLHFEIRDETTQKPINPLYFGYKPVDKNPPVINFLKVFPHGPNSMINNEYEEKVFTLRRSDNKFSLINKDTITITGNAYFGINTFDPFNNGNNKNGVFSISLLVDSGLIYEHTLETFSFAESRYINSLIDYKEYKQLKRRVQKSYLQPNNRLSIYNEVADNGIVKFEEGKIYNLLYRIYDFEGNVSELNFVAKGGKHKESSRPLKEISNNSIKEFYFCKTNTHSTSDFKIEVPGKALYENIEFQYDTLPKKKTMYSGIHVVHFSYVPLHSWCDLFIRPDSSLSLKFYDKAIIAKINSNTGYSSAGGEPDNGFIKTRIRDFGNYCILIDTVAPKITPQNIRNNKNLEKQSTIKIKIKDNLSGIDSYRGTLNGKWILMEYDRKKNLLIYHFDDQLQKGENLFKLVVSDNKKNYSSYNASVTF